MDLADTQRRAIECEDDLIPKGKWKKEIQTKGSSSNTTSSDEMLQKLSNELVEMKKQLLGFNNSYQQNFQNVSGRSADNKFPQLTGPEPRLQIEAAPKKGNMCMFHLTMDHDSENYPETICMMQLLATNELNVVAPCADLDTYSNGNSKNLFVEYESDFETKGECFATIDETSYTVLTQGQKLKNQFSS